MRPISLLVLFLSLLLKTNGQTNSSDTIEELSVLKNLRSTLIERKARLKEEVYYKQALIDSIRQKIEKSKETIKELPSSTKKKDKEVRRLEHDLQETEVVLNEIEKQLTKSKELLEKGSTLITEVDARIRQLSSIHDSVLTDSDGNRYEIKRLFDDNLWMTTNLKLNIPGSYCYNDSIIYCEKYGRLYTWEAAQKGCALLGEGWRIPSKNEWQELAALYAGVEKDSIVSSRKAYHPLLHTGSSLFNAQLGGGRDLSGQYARLEAHGFYWTTTKTDSSTAWFANFAKGSKSLYIQPDGETPRAFSVRCIKDMQREKQ